jgi:hypothetical protein
VQAAGRQLNARGISILDVAETLEVIKYQDGVVTTVKQIPLL